MLNLNKIISKLDLKKHPEGGWFRETYRSANTIPEDILNFETSGERNYSTAIYYLLERNDFSSFHKIKSDEIWHYHFGSSLSIYSISKEGNLTTSVLGMNLEKNEEPQVLVKAGEWFAAEPKDNNNYSLVSCTVSPGFDFEDFEIAERNKLIETYPQHKSLINMLTRLN